MSETMTPFSYEGPPPKEYRCGGCSASGVRLYRDYRTIARASCLFCTECAERAGGEPRKVDPERPDLIGGMVAAVPTEDGDTFWGFSSVPWRGVYWWRALPTAEGRPQSPEHIIAWLLRNTSDMQTLLEVHGRMRARDDAEIARLRAALKPFAERVDAFSHECDDDQTVGVPLGDCRAALKALGQES